MNDTLTKVLLVILKRLVLIIVVASILIMGGFMAYQTSNIYIIVEEGMEVRANSVILPDDEETEILLRNFFTMDYIKTSPKLSDKRYKGYPIESFAYNIDIDFMWPWPWKDTIKVDVEESIYSFNLKNTQDNDEDLQVAVPEWDNGKKEVHLMKVDRSWKIYDVKE
ncbi:MAG TPA: hypothetical protein GXZ32_08055 [Clostridiales bacterium]|nr:hypothetical protein [Clostridiales bacterium]